jgi:hypothetical protein
LSFEGQRFAGILLWYTQNLKIPIFLLFAFDFILHTLTFAVLSQNGGMVTTVEVETKFKG